jgi:hypothetical protein
MTRRDPRPRLANRRKSHPHAHPPEVCSTRKIDDRFDCAAASPRVVAPATKPSQPSPPVPTLEARTIERT